MSQNWHTVRRIIIWKWYRWKDCWSFQTKVMNIFLRIRRMWITFSIAILEVPLFLYSPSFEGVYRNSWLTWKSYLPCSPFHTSHTFFSITVKTFSYFWTIHMYLPMAFWYFSRDCFCQSRIHFPKFLVLVFVFLFCNIS